MAEIDFTNVAPDTEKDGKTLKRFVPIGSEGRRYYMSKYEWLLDKMLRVTLYPTASMAEYGAQKITGKPTDEPSLLSAAKSGFTGKQKTMGSDVAGALLPEKIGEEAFTPAFWTRFEGVPEQLKSIGEKYENVYTKLTPDVKTKAVVGAPLDFALDWTSYLGWSGAGHTANIANKIKQTNVARRIALAASDIPYMGEVGKSARNALRALITDPLYHAKQTLKIDLVIDRAKKLGVPEDIIKAAQHGEIDPVGAERELLEIVDAAKQARIRRSVINNAIKSSIDYDNLTPESVFTRNAIQRGADLTEGIDLLQEVERKAAVSRLRAFKTVEDKYYRLFSGQKAIEARAKDQMRPIMRAWKQLKKTNPEAYNALMDAWEDAIPIPKNGHWGFSEKFYSDLRRLGITEEEITQIQASVLRPIANEIPDEAIQHLVDLGATEEGARNALGKAEYIFPWELPEYDKALSVALDKISPNAKYAYQCAVQIKKGLAQILMDKQWMTREEIVRFAQETGLNHILHELKPKMRKSIDQYAVNLRKSWVSKIDEELQSVPEGRGINLNPVRQIRNILETGNISELLRHEEFFDKSVDVLNKVARDNNLHPGVRIGANRLLATITNIRTRRQILGKVSEIHEIIGKSAYEDDLTKLILREEIKVKSAIGLQNYVNEVSKAFPELLKPIRRAPEKIPPGFSVFKDTGTDRMFLVQNDFAPAFKARFQVANNTDDFTRKLLAGMYGIYNEMNQVFKYTVTVPFIQFIERNFVSSIAIGAQAGLENPKDMLKYYDRAMTFYRKLWSGDNKARELYYKFIEEDMARGGFSRVEAFEKTGVAIGAIKSVPGVKQYLTGMEAATELGDDLPKIALYFFAQEAGPSHWKRYGTFKDAFEFVRKMMPVYRPGTQFEQRFLQNIIPFYRWDRYNIPINVEMMARNPRFFLNIEKIRREATVAFGGEEKQDWMPDYIKEGYPIGVKPEKGGTYRYFMLRGWLASPSLNDLLTPKDWKENVMQRVTPYAKVPYELATNKSTFTGRKIEKAPGETEELLGVRMRKKYSHILRSVRLINMVDKMFFPKYNESPTQRAIHAFVGKLYTIDEDKTKDYVLNMLEMQINSLKWERDYLLQNGDEKPAERIQKVIEKLYEEKDRL